MDLQALRDAHSALTDEMERLITPPEDLNETERSEWDMDDAASTRFDECVTEAKDLAARIDDAEKRHAELLAARDVARVGGDDADGNRGGFETPNVNLNPEPWDLNTVRFDATVSELRGRIETGLEGDSVTPDDVKTSAMATLRNVVGDRASVARLYLATGSQVYRSAFAKAAVGNFWQLDNDERDALVRAQSLTNTAGGFAVPFTLDPSIILTDVGSINPFRGLARVVQTTTDSWNGVTGGAATASWDAEAAEVSDDSIALGQPAIPVHKMNVFIPFSVEIEGDWAAIDSDLRMAMMEGRDNLEALAHAKGTGTAQPTGIETALDGTPSEIAPQTAETFASPDVYGLQSALPPRHRMGSPTWVMNIGTANAIRQFDTAGGSNFWADLTQGTPPTMAGWAWSEASEVDDAVDINPAAVADNFILFVGDWSRYVIVDRVGMSVELVPTLFGSNQRPTGQRGLYGWLRTGADIVDANAFRVLSIPTA